MKKVIRYFTNIIFGSVLLLLLFLALILAQPIFKSFILQIKEPKCLKNYGCGSGGANQKKKHHSKKNKKGNSKNK